MSNIYCLQGHAPAEIIRKNPEIVHIVLERFGVAILSNVLYLMNETKWREKYDTMHLLINHKYLWVDHNKHAPKDGELNETNIWNFNYTIGYMFRDILTRMKPLLGS